MASTICFESQYSHTQVDSGANAMDGPEICSSDSKSPKNKSLENSVKKPVKKYPQKARKPRKSKYDTMNYPSFILIDDFEEFQKQKNYYLKNGDKRFSDWDLTALRRGRKNREAEKISRLKREQLVMELRQTVSNLKKVSGNLKECNSLLTTEIEILQKDINDLNCAINHHLLSQPFKFLDEPAVLAVLEGI